MELELVEKNIQKKNEKKKERSRGFRLSGKSLFLTYPRCLLARGDLGDFIRDKIAVEYLLICKENHQDGTPHLHALAICKKKYQSEVATCLDVAGYHGNYQTARDTDQVRDYIMKYDTEPYVYGLYQSNNQSAVQKRALQNKLILSKPLNELVDEGIVHLSQYKQYAEAIKAYTLDSIKVPDYMPKKCIWIFGETGVGKSRYIRDNHPGACYFKPQNKWWDGYNGEKVILIDDFDHSGYGLGHYLKIWADCYSFNAEVKGNTIRPVYDTFYITSQYLPEQIWKPTDVKLQDEEMVAAIERRFTIMCVKDGVLENYWDKIKKLMNSA